MQPDAGTSKDVFAAADGAASPKASSAASRPSARARTVPKTRASDANVGTVLRSVYQSAVQEDIPAEMLDLLSKLD